MANNGNRLFVAAGIKHSFAIKDGSLFAWGYNHMGQLGLGDQYVMYVPLRVGKRDDWEQVSTAGARTLGICGGELYAWGYEGPPLGLRSSGDIRHPSRVGSRSDWQYISTSTGHSLGIAGGNLFAWGRNVSGKLGIEDPSAHPSLIYDPVQVGDFSDWEKVSAGRYHSLGIRAGRLYWWGSFAQNPQESHLPKRVFQPKEIGEVSGWTDISAGPGFSLAICEGQIFCWGKNDFKQLGFKGSPSEEGPALLEGRVGWSNISAAGTRSSGISNGRLFLWGEDRTPQVIHRPERDNAPALNQTGPLYSPAAIDDNFDWEAVSLGGSHILAIRNGTVFAWGGNTTYQLGTCDTADRVTPTEVRFPKAL